MIGNIKEIFPPKTGLREKQLLQDPGYVKDVRDALLHAACCMISAEYPWIAFSLFNYFD